MAVFSLWVKAPLVAAHPISHASGMYIMIHNSSKITVVKKQQDHFMVGVSTTGGTGLKGHSIRKAESHWSRAIAFNRK